jgi:hypothetical protein
MSPLKDCPPFKLNHNTNLKSRIQRRCIKKSKKKCREVTMDSRILNLCNKFHNQYWKVADRVVMEVGNREKVQDNSNNNQFRSNNKKFMGNKLISE